MEQNPIEFEWMLNHIRGASSLLEIGSRDGGSLLGMAKAVKSGARLRSIDIGKGPDRPDASVWLKGVIRQLRMEGFDAECLIWDSHDKHARNWAFTHMPQGGYDFVFIDGDHTFEGVKQDWEWYGKMGKLVGFHDINGVQDGVCKLWPEIKAKHRTIELSGMANFMGIGIVRMTDDELGFGGDPKFITRNSGSPMGLMRIV